MKVSMRALRVIVAALVLAVALISFHLDAAIGTLCALCPVGFLQVSFASGSIPWALLPGVAAVLLIVFALGRVFCSWFCPTSFLKNIFGGHTPRGILGRAHVSCKGGTEGPACSAQDKGFKTQAVLLTVLLALSFIVKFPVFCLICPIGLVFGTLWAVNRVFVLLEPGWELIIFPLMLVAELFLFKRWCSALCPLGFFFTLVAKARTKMRIGLKPTTDTATCIAREGCVTCSVVCGENIDVASAQPEDLEACTMCLDCIEGCPTKSIKVGVEHIEERMKP